MSKVIISDQSVGRIAQIRIHVAEAAEVGLQLNPNKIAAKLAAMLSIALVAFFVTGETANASMTDTSISTTSGHTISTGPFGPGPIILGPIATPNVGDGGGNGGDEGPPKTTCLIR